MKKADLQPKISANDSSYSDSTQTHHILSKYLAICSQIDNLTSNIDDKEYIQEQSNRLFELLGNRFECIVSIDRLSLSIPMTKPEVANLLGRLQELNQKKDVTVGESGKAKYYFNHKRVYLTNDRNDFIDLYYAPHSEAANYIKVEYNPNRLTDRAILRLAKFYKLILGNRFWRKRLKKAELHRLDFAFDLLGIDIQLVNLKVPYRVRETFSGDSERVTWFRYGSSRANHIKIYDKRHWLLNQKFGYSPKHLTAHWTRLEFTQVFRSGARPILGQYSKMAPNISRFEVYDPLMFTTPDLPKLALLTCNFYSISSILDYLKKHEFESYSKAKSCVEKSQNLIDKARIVKQSRLSIKKHLRTIFGGPF
jgi:hypothetical protein